VPLITLLTDFGTCDTFVGVMKGVIAQRCGSGRIVDLTHAIEPQDVVGAGYALADSWRYFPPGTVHVAVVDPGVGTQRRILAARVDRQIMLAPDNGLLSAVFASTAPTEVRQVSRGELFCKPVSGTFHGRDIFAPVAGALAAGLAPADVGPIVDRWVTLDLPQATVDDAGVVRGQVIVVDRFGNLITNVPGPMLPLLPRVSIGGIEVGRVSGSYGETSAGQAVALVGSHGRLEIAVNGRSAAAEFGAGRRTPVKIVSAAADSC
jgi:hypothetical protein